MTSPRAGIVFRLQSTEGTFLRAGSPLCTIIAQTDKPMVEVWLHGQDMPLVTARETGPEGQILREGSPVRLQFEGWPALQIIGWPSLARGTFGGEVVLVDPTDNGKGSSAFSWPRNKMWSRARMAMRLRCHGPVPDGSGRGFEPTVGSCCNGFRCGTRCGAS